MARVIRFYRTFLHVVRVRELHAFRVQFSHVRVFSDSRNVQKSVTQIIYLGPLPSGGDKQQKLEVKEGGKLGSRTSTRNSKSTPGDARARCGT